MKLLERFANARTIEGKAISVILVLSLALMAWDANALSYAFADDGGSSASQKADAGDKADKAEKADKSEKAEKADKAADDEATLTTQADDSAEKAKAAEEAKAAAEAEAAEKAAKEQAEREAAEKAAAEKAAAEAESAKPVVVAEDDAQQSAEPTKADDDAAQDEVPPADVSDDDAADQADDATETPSAANDDEAAADDTATADDENTAADDTAVPKDADKAKADDEKDALAYPAVTLYGKAKGTTVKLTAPKGSLPEGIQMRVKDVTSEKVADKVEAATGDVLVDFQAIDITLVDKNNKEVQPKKPVKVEFSGVDLESDDVNVYHIEDNGSIDEVNLIKADADTQSFKADSFSIYVVGVEGTPLLTVNFQQAGGNVVSIDVKKADAENIKSIVYDPGTGDLGSNVVFLGWTTDKDYTTDTAALDIDAVRNAVVDTLDAGFEDGASVTYYAMTFNQFVVSCQNEAGVVLNTAQALSTGDEATITVNASYTVSDNKKGFLGWKVKDGDDTIYQNGDTLTLSSPETILIPEIGEGNWLIFDENDDTYDANGKKISGGASFAAPAFIPVGESAASAEPADLTRPGYIFDGWYTKAEGGVKFNFNTVITEETSVYAHWKANENATYKVIIWKQKVTDDKNAAVADKTYDYSGEMYELTGKTGATITKAMISSYLNKTGDGYKYGNNTMFKYDRYEIVDGNGNPTTVIGAKNDTVVNVYYNRALYTIEFHKTDRTSAMDTTVGDRGYMTGLYGQPLSKYGYSWPSGRWYGIAFLDSFSGTLFGASGLGGNANTIQTYKDGKTNITIIFLTQDLSDERIYKEAARANYETSIYAGATSGEKSKYGRFKITDRFTGMTPTGYKWATADSVPTDWDTQTEDGGYTSSRRTSEKQGYLFIKYDRVQNSLVFMNGSEKVKEISGIPYEKSLASYEFQAPTVDADNGYYFAGWYEDAALTQPFDWNSQMPPAGKMIYAKVAPQRYHVVADANGGTLANGQSDSFRVDYGGTIDSTNFHAATKEGHTLVGWYTDEACTQPFNFNTHITDGVADMTYKDNTVLREKYGDNTDSRADVVGLVTLYALWSDDSIANSGGIKVRYVNADGEVVSTDSTGYADSSSVITKSAPASIPEGKQFSGWKLGNTDAVYNPGQSFVARIADAKQDEDGTYTLTLTATYSDKETAERTTISYNANGGQGSIANQPLTVNEAVTISDGTGFTREGYELVGWATTPNGAKAFDLGQSYVSADNESAPNVLYAVWEISTFTVQFVDEDGQTVLDKQTVEYGKTPVYGGETPTKAATAQYTYTFAGWTPEIATVTKDATYTATYTSEVNKYTVTFDSKGGTEVENQTVEYGSTATKPADPTRDGYIFMGWQLDGTDYSFDIVVTGDITLTAVWAQEVEVFVTDAAKTVTYNGSRQEFEAAAGDHEANADAYTITYKVGGAEVESLPDGVTQEVTIVAAKGTAAGTYNNGSVKVVLNTTSGKYLVSSANGEATGAVTLEILPAALTITTGSDKKEYDGQPLTNSEATIEGLVNGETATVTATGSITEVGTSDNTYEITWGSANPENYSITAKLGALEVTNHTSAVVLTAKSDSKPYDGTALTNDGVDATGLPEGFFVKAVVVGSVTNVSDNARENNIITSYKIYRATSYDDEGEVTGKEDKTDYFTNVTTVAGTLTINPKAVTITTGSASKAYDGTALTKGEAGIEGLVDGESATVKATGAITEVGSTPNGYNIVWDNATAGNYTVTDNLGTLTVTENDVQVTLTAASGSKTYDGTALTKSEVTASGLPEGFAVEATASGSATNVGDAGVNAVNDGYIIKNAAGEDRTSSFTNVEKVAGTLTINPKAVTITTGSASKAYDGTALTKDEADIEGLVDGETAAVKATGTITEVGDAANTYSIEWGTAKASNYAVTENLGTLTVAANNSEITLTAASDEKTYDGASLTNSGVTASGLPEGFTVEATASGSQTDAGEGKNIVNDGYVIKNTSGQDATRFFTNVKKVDGTLTIDKKEVTITTGSASKAYDGTALTKDEAGIEGLVDGETATVKATGTVTEVGSTSNAYSIEWGKTNKDNYTVKESLGTLTITENDAQVTLTAASDEKTYDGTALTNSGVTASGLPEGFTVEATASGSATNVGDAGVNAVNDGYKILDKDGNDKTANFTNVNTVSGTLTINPKTILVTGETDSRVYTGSEQELNGITYGELATGDKISGLTYSAKGKNVGGYDGAFSGTVKIENAEGDDVTGSYTVTQTPGKLTITPASIELTLTGETDEKAYNGVEQQLTAITPAGLLPGHELKNITYVAKGTTVGNYEGSFDGDAKVFDGDEDVTENYVITKKPGTLTITPAAALKVQAKSAEKVYNGTPLTLNGYELIEGALATGDSLAVVVEGSQTDAGENANAITSIKVMHGTEDVTASYASVETEKGTLTVTPKPVTISTGAGEKPYDGTALTNDEVGITGLIEGEGVTLAATGSQTDVGKSDNTYSIAWDNAKASNYSVTDELGKLKVTENSVKITLTAPTLSWAYSGMPLTSVTEAADDTDGITAEGLPNDITLKSATAVGTITDVGTAGNSVVDKSWKFVDANGKDVTAYFTNVGTTDGALTVTPATLTVKTDSANKVYDGKALTAGGTIEGFVNGESAPFAVTGSQTEVGASKNTYTIDWDSEDATAKKDNYTVEETVGDLVVTENEDEIVVTTTGGTFPYDGKEHGATVTVSKLPAGYTLEVAASSTKATDVTTESVLATADTLVIKNAQGADVTSKLKITYVDGQITVDPAPLTVAMPGASKKYDGTALTAKGTLVGLVNNEIATLVTTGSQTEIGKSENVYRIEWGTAKESNYTVSASVGELEVTANDAEISLTAPSASKEYDGTALTADGSAADKKVTATGLPNGFTLEATASGTQTNVGKSNNVVNDGYVIKNAAGENKTGNFTNVKKNPGTLEVTPKEITVTANSANFTYNGEAQSDAGYAVVGLVGSDKVNADISGSITFPDESPVANVVGDVVFTAGSADNYTVTKVNGELNMGKASQAITIKANSNTFGYDSNPHADNGVTLAKGELFPDDTLVASAEGSVTNVSDTAEGNNLVASGAKIMHGNVDVTGNYIITPQAGTLTVTPAQIEVTAKSDTKPYDGTPLTNDGWDITKGEFYGDDGFESVAVEGSQTLVGTSDNKITGHTLKAGTIADNYDISYVEGTLEVTNRAEADRFPIEVVSNSGKFNYDATEHTVEGFETLNFTVNDQTFTVEGLSASVSGLNADTYTNAIAGTPIVKDANDIDVTAQFVVTLTPGTLTINKAKATFEGQTASKEYTGSEITLSKVSLTGLMSGHKSNVSYEAKGTIPGEYEGTITPKGQVVITDENDVDVTANYDITTAPGKLTITDRETPYPIEVVAKSKTEKYDGAEKTVEGFETLSFTIEGNEFTVEGLAASVSGTDAGAYTNEVTGKAFVRDAEGEDVTKQFAVSTTNGSLNISKREVSLTSATDKKTYNGSPLTNDEITVGGDGFVEGEGATYDVTGSQTIVGSSENTFTYKLKEGTKADNYTITTAEGTLTVESRDAKYEITVEANSLPVPYDGNPHTASGFKTLSFEVEGNTYEVSGISTSSPTETSAGKYPNNITGIPVVKDADGNDVSGEFAVSTKNGSLDIAKRVVNVSVKDAETTYKGDEQTGNTDYEFDKVVLGQTATIGYTPAKGTAAGEYDNGAYADDFTVMAGDQDVTANYTLKDKVPGKLTIKKAASAAITIEGNSSANVVFDGAEHSVEGFTTNAADVDKSIEVSLNAGKAAFAVGTNAGTYRMGLTPSDFTATSPNFEQVAIEYNDGALTIVPANLNDSGRITVSQPSNVTYNGAEQKQPVVVSDAVTGQTLVEGVDYELAYSDDTVNAGTVTVNVVGLGNYDGVLSRTYNIDPANLTVTIDAKSKTYGEADPELTATVSGLQGNDSESLVSYTLTRASGEAVGSYAITGDGAAIQGNYALTFVPSTFIINPLPQYTLLIHYVYEDGSMAAADYTSSLVEGAEYSVRLPEIDGYSPVDANGTSISRLRGSMPAQDVELTITYVADNSGTIIVDPDPADNPGDDTTTNPATPTNPGATTPAANPAGAGTAAPAAPAADAAATGDAAPAPAADATITIDDDGNPLAQAIDDDETPLASGEGSGEGTWSLFDLLATLATAIICIALLVGALRRNDRDDDDPNGAHVAAASNEEDELKKRRRALRIASLVPAVAAVVALVLTQDFSQPMAIFDQWSLLFAIAAGVQVVDAVLCRDKTENPEDNDPQPRPQGFAPATA